MPETTAISEEERKKIEDQLADNDSIIEPYSINQVVKCMLVPPPMDRPHSSWRAVIYTKSRPKKTFVANRTYPRELEVHTEHMTEELNKEDVVLANLVQLTSHEQFVKVDGDIYDVIGMEIHSNDSINDPDLKREWTDQYYAVSLTFRMHPNLDSSIKTRIDHLGD